MFTWELRFSKSFGAITVRKPSIAPGPRLPANPRRWSMKATARQYVPGLWTCSVQDRPPLPVLKIFPTLLTYQPVSASMKQTSSCLSFAGSVSSFSHRGGSPSSKGGLEQPTSRVSTSANTGGRRSSAVGFRSWMLMADRRALGWDLVILPVLRPPLRPSLGAALALTGDRVKRVMDRRLQHLPLRLPVAVDGVPGIGGRTAVLRRIRHLAGLLALAALEELQPADQRIDGGNPAKAARRLGPGAGAPGILVENRGVDERRGGLRFQFAQGLDDLDPHGSRRHAGLGVLDQPLVGLDERFRGAVDLSETREDQGRRDPRRDQVPALGDEGDEDGLGLGMDGLTERPDREDEFVLGRPGTVEVLFELGDGVVRLGLGGTRDGGFLREDDHAPDDQSPDHHGPHSPATDSGMSIEDAADFDAIHLQRIFASALLDDSDHDLANVLSGDEVHHLPAEP